MCYFFQRQPFRFLVKYPRMLYDHFNMAGFNYCMLPKRHSKARKSIENFASTEYIQSTFGLK